MAASKGNPAARNSISSKDTFGAHIDILLKTPRFSCETVHFSFKTSKIEDINLQKVDQNCEKGSSE